MWLVIYETLLESSLILLSIFSIDGKVGGSYFLCLDEREDSDINDNDPLELRDLTLVFYVCASSNLSI